MKQVPLFQARSLRLIAAAALSGVLTVAVILYGAARYDALAQSIARAREAQLALVQYQLRLATAQSSINELLRFGGYDASATSGSRALLQRRASTDAVLASNARHVFTNVSADPDAGVVAVALPEHAHIYLKAVERTLAAGSMMTGTAAVDALRQLIALQPARDSALQASVDASTVLVSERKVAAHRFREFAMRSLAGGALALLGIGLITIRRDRRQAEANAGSERDDIAGHMTEAYFCVAPDWTISAINERAKAWLARRGADPIAHSLWNAGPAFEDAGVRDTLRRAMAIQDAATCTAFLAGTGQWLELRVYPLGRGLAVFIQDVTARHASLAELKSAEARFRLLAENTLDIVALHDRTSRFTYVSPSMSRVFGHRPEDLVTHLPEEWMHPEDIERFTGFWNANLSAETPQHFLGRFRTAAGAYLWFETIISPVRDDEDRVTTMISSSRDVTARKRLENQFLQSQRMEAVGRLASGVAHDFNNIMMVIGSNAAFLRDRDDCGDLEEVNEIEVAVRHAAALTRQLLAFGRNREATLSVVDVNDVVLEVRRLLSRVIGPAVHIETTLSPAMVPIMADQSHVSQIVMNLAVNARDAMPDGGRLTIGTTLARIGEAEASEQNVSRGLFAVIEVRDTGAGMDKETLAKMYEPFFSTKAEGIGTGLGLPTVLGIVQRARGFVRVESVVGVGSVFFVHLPVAPAFADAEPQTPERTQDGGGETIVLVEDDYLVREAML